MTTEKNNPMKEIEIEKLTLNVCVGESGDKLENAKILLERISDSKVVYTHAKKRIPTWNLRYGLAIGVKTTIRGKKVYELLKRLFESVENNIHPKNFDNEGNLSFGIKEYIHIPDVKYDPSLGIIGLDVCITLKRKSGYRVKRRNYKKSRVGKKHRISKEESMNFFKENFKITIGEKKRRLW